MFNRKAKPATEADLEYMLEVKRAGCLCCKINVERSSRPTTGLNVEFNHHVRGNKRRGRRIGTGECLWHHRGEPRDGWTKAAMLQAFGPARNYQGGKGNFAAHYGTDEELLEFQAEVLGTIRNVLA